jgi:hypothetical protein
MTARPHLVFSPDLAPSDFSLFGALKGQLSGCVSESAEKLADARHQIASAILRTTLERALLEWEERLQRCIDINGAYID